MSRAKLISGHALRVYLYELITNSGLDKAEACVEIRRASGCSLRRSVIHYDQMAADLDQGCVFSPVETAD